MGILGQWQAEKAFALFQQVGVFALRRLRILFFIDIKPIFALPTNRTGEWIISYSEGKGWNQLGKR